MGKIAEIVFIVFAFSMVAVIGIWIKKYAERPLKKPLKLVAGSKQRPATPNLVFHVPAGTCPEPDLSEIDRLLADSHALQGPYG